MREYKKPAFLWGRAEDDTLKGSCRSEGQTDVVALMHAVTEDIFIDRGGHKMSGGFSILTENIHLLDAALNASYEKMYADNVAAEEESLADHSLSLDDIDFRLWDIVDKLSPFGMDNAKPIFLFKGVMPSDVKRFGKLKEHLDIVFMKGNGKKISAISFFADEDERFANIEAGRAFDLVATLERSTFKNYPELRLRIVDVC
jgi:single-stranded-DNA-specific exonuclease